MLWRSDTQPHVYRLRTNYQPVGIVVPLVTGIRHTDHITPVLQSLHWLPVQQRVTFKLATLVHKCLNGRAPGYHNLADDFCRTGRGRPGSRSATSMMLDIPRMTTSLGDRAFAVAGPRVWNSLPPAIRDP